MSESTFTMLLQMGNKTESLDGSLEYIETFIDAPQLKMQPNMGEKLRDVLQHSLAAQYTPMD